MPRRPRPPESKGSEYWLREMVNRHTSVLNGHIKRAFGWHNVEIEWKSPLRNDDYAEYYDQEFLDRLGLNDLRMSLREFWPKSGPRWDALACANQDRFILVEAKAHIEECIDFKSRASPRALARIARRLDEAKAAFRATADAYWHSPLYQMANRLAHLHFLAGINGKDAYLVFVHFADAPDVKAPVSREAWTGAIRLARKCFGLTNSALARRVADVIIDADDFCGRQSTGASPQQHHPTAI